MIKWVRNARHLKLEGELKEEVAQLKKELSAVKKANNTLKEENRFFIEEFNNSSSKLREVENENSELKELVEKCKDNRKYVRDEIRQEYERDYSSLQKHYDHLVKENKSLQERVLKHLKEDNNSLNKDTKASQLKQSSLPKERVYSEKDSNGTRTYYYGDRRPHNPDGPAVIFNDGTEMFYIHGTLHNTKGLAINGPYYKKYYIDGVELSREEFYNHPLCEITEEESND